MNFEPMSDEEMDNLTPKFQVGITTFSVIEAEEKVSGAGNPMIEIVLQCTDEMGTKWRVYDWLMTLPKMMFKLKHFCEATGMPDKYHSKKLSAADCLESTGVCITEKQKNKDGTPKIGVKDYIEIDPDKMPEAFNDEIPF